MAGTYRSRTQAASGMARATAVLVCFALLPAALGRTRLGDDEAAIMRELRQALCDAVNLADWESGPGWDPGNPAHHCTWEHVVCNAAGYVTKLHVSFLLEQGPNPPTGLPVKNRQNRAQPCGSAHGASQPVLVLPPSLAGLQLLEVLDISLPGDFHPRLAGGIPPEWGVRGTFPRLEQLELRFHDAVASRGAEHVLPAIQPGALPALQSLLVHLPSSTITLPASWGSSPDVLPALTALEVYACTMAGDLPQEWARGFKSLRRLTLLLDATGSCSLGADLPGGLGRAVLRSPPAVWGSGFPRLQELSLVNLRLSGLLPDAWTQSGFPELRTLELSGNELTGPLPPLLLAKHPMLLEFRAVGNNFSGSLPAAWAASQVHILQLDGNSLTGPAFPPEWIEPGALPLLVTLQLGGSRGLTGTLPASLPWPRIRTLLLSRTSVTGSIPESWCSTTLRMLGLAGTAVDPTLPARCAHSLVVGNGTGQNASTDNDTYLSWGDSQLVQPKQRAALLSTSLVAPLAALAAIAGVAAFRQRRRQRLAAAARHQQDLQSLQRLQHRRRHSAAAAGTAAAAAGGGDEGEGEPPAEDAVLAGTPALHRRPPSRSARLRAVLQAELRKRGGHSLELAALGALPAGLAHQVVGPAHTWGQARGGHCGAGQEEERSMLLPGAARSDAFGGGLPWALERAARPDALLASRQWGLPTDSLRLATGQLEFATDLTSGALVELGEGALAAVFAARLNGELVAAKVVELEPHMDSTSLWREVSLLHLCNHPRIVRLLGVVLSGQLLILAMELMKGGSLRGSLQHATRREELRWGERGRQVALDVAEALDHLHSKLGVMHGDIKSGNILLSTDYRASVADLGVAQIMNSSPAAMLGCSGMYAAPEQLMGQPCTLVADMYSFGIVLIELTTRQLAVKRGQWHLPRAPDDCPEAVVQLIKDCIQFDPDARPSAAEARQRLLEAA